MDASHNKIKTISKNLIPKNIETINLSNNLIEEIPSGTFINKKQLKKIDLQENLIRNLQITSLLMSKISVDREFPDVYLAGNLLHCDCSMEWLKNINELSDQRRQHPKLRDIKDIQCTLEHNHDQNDMKPVKHLLDLMSSDFLCKYENHCFPLCQCCNEGENPMNNSDANCNCQMTCPDQCSCYHDNTWNRNIVDCGEVDLTAVPSKIPNDVTILYLDGNNIDKLTYNNFLGKKRLEALYLNNSNIEKIAANTFDDLKNLRILRINNNRLSNLNGNEFSNQLLLNKLYLDHNQIGNIAENTFVHLKYLKVIDLSNNRLIDFDPVKQLATSSNTGALSKVFLDGDNKWNCDCKSLLKLVEWIRHRSENFNLNRMVCTDNRIVGDVLSNCQIISSFDYNRENHIEESTPHLSDDMIYHKNIVTFDSSYDQAWLTGSGGYISIFAAVLVTIIVVALVIAIVCVFRQDIKLLTFDKFGVRLFDCARKNRRNQVHQCNHPNDHMVGDECYPEKTYDAYLISSMNDRDLLSQVIVPEMQNMGYAVSCYNQHYKTLHPHNNHYSGSYLLDTFKYGSDCSHKTILLISLNFLQNEWCDNGFRYALQSIIESESYKNNKIILILTVPIQIIQMDPILQILLKNSTVICWGEKRFWSKLRYELPDVVGNKGLLNKYANNIVDNFGNVRYTSAPTATMQSARSVNTAYNPGGWYNAHPLLCSGYSSPLNYKQQYYANPNNMMMQNLPYEYCSPEHRMTPQNSAHVAETSNESDNLQHVYSTIPETISLSGMSNASSDSLKSGEI
jgi:Leucine-rich repeat (LRR) protein